MGLAGEREAAMKLSYNGTDLAALGVFRILQTSTVREPAENPQWERVTVSCRLDFFEQSYLDNFSLVQQVRAALKAQQVTLLWQDDSGAKYVERTVSALGDETDGSSEERGGTYRQALTFRFTYLNHDVTTNTLKASAQGLSQSGQPSGQVLDLGAVTNWAEAVRQTRFDELRDPRRLATGTVRAAGRLLGDTLGALGTRQTALLAAKDALIATMVKGATVTLKFGSFSQAVRVSEFEAVVDQPANYISWSVAASFTRFPDETDYSLIEVRVAYREQMGEAIPRLNLSGRIHAPSEVLARGRLALLQGALAPAAYVLESTETDARTVGSESDRTASGALGAADPYDPRRAVSGLALEAGDGDGLVFTELTFNLEYRDTTGLACNWKRTGPQAVTVDLGTVDGFRERNVTTLFDEMRDARKRASGQVSMEGRWFVPDNLSDGDKQTALLAKKAALEGELLQGIDGALFYGTAAGPLGVPPATAAFNKNVRVLDFNAEIDRLKKWIKWNVSATFTRFPNEADYALCEFQVETRENKTDGTAHLRLSGRIGAPTPEAAREKLGRLRLQLVPDGYKLLEEDTNDHRVEVESDRATLGTPSPSAVDETAYIELTFNDDYQKAAGDLLTWTVRVAVEDDAPSGNVRTTYAGSVLASGPDLATAYATAAAQAAVLGDGKLPFKVRGTVTENDRLFQTVEGDDGPGGGLVFVGVDFSYDYLSKGPSRIGPARVYLEMTSELHEDLYGLRTETVSGSIGAPSLALATAAYLANVRNTTSYTGALLLNERTPTVAESRIYPPDLNSALGVVEGRFTFSFQVLRPKGTSSTAANYTVEPVTDFQTLEVRTVVRGTVRAASASLANAYVDTLIGGMALGKRVRSARPVETQQGPAVSGGGATVFTALHFTEEYVALLAGQAGVLECEVSEDIVYSGNRLVEKPNPDGTSIIQACGIVAGRRTVHARAAAVTESAARVWVAKQRTGLLTGSGVAGATQWEQPAQVTTVFRFLPLTDGTARGTGANVRLFEAVAVFSELLPDYAYS